MKKILSIIIFSLLFITTANAQDPDPVREYWESQVEQAEKEFDILKKKIQNDISDKKLETKMLKALGLVKKDIDDDKKVKSLEDKLSLWDIKVKAAVYLPTGSEDRAKEKEQITALHKKINKLINKQIERAAKKLKKKKRMDKLAKLGELADEMIAKSLRIKPKGIDPSDVDEVEELLDDSAVLKSDVWDEMIEALKNLRKFLDDQHKEVIVVLVPPSGDLSQPFKELSLLLETAKNLKTDFQAHLMQITVRQGGRAIGLKHALKESARAEAKLVGDAAKKGLVAASYLSGEYPKEIIEQIDASGIFDLLRGTLQVDTPQELIDLATYIDANEIVVRKKDRFFNNFKRLCDQKTTDTVLVEVPPGGYRDIQYVIRFPKKGFPYMLAEVQVNLKYNLELKKIGHSLYDISRGPGEGSVPVDKLEKVKTGLQGVINTLKSNNTGGRFDNEIRDAETFLSRFPTVETVSATGEFEGSVKIIAADNTVELAKLKEISEALYSLNDEAVKQAMEVKNLK